MGFEASRLQNFMTAEADGLARFSESAYLPDAVQSSPFESWQYALVKRIIDVALSSVLFFLFALPGVLIAAAVVLTSSGGVFYREERIGRAGRLFRIWKFRTMCQASDGPADSEKSLYWRSHKGVSDPRITRIGGFLRSWSLDELPQLLNVLRGEMSLIGPRPIVEAEAVFYGDRIEAYLTVLPGLSGLWQVSGRSQIDYAHRAELDASYAENWSLMQDLVIALRTIPAVLTRVGAH
jgi:lipopolysaccharide/colanic/teichoic acid biosynthesis glycosyltransferase